MRLLFDQNLSYRLAELLAPLYPHSLHARDAGLSSAEDATVWEYAKAHDLMIVSKDSDFHQRSFVFGFPPKDVWVRLGNCSTAQVERLLRERVSAIADFSHDAEAAFLSLS